MPTPNIISCKLSEQDRGFEYAAGEKGSYELKWDVTVDYDYLAGPYVLEMARQHSLPAPHSKIPVYGEPYTLHDFTDGGAFAKKFSGRLKEVTNLRNWEFTVSFEPPDVGQTETSLQDPNPLNYPVEYWVEWIEEQVPLEKAECFTDMYQISRGPKAKAVLPSCEPGAIVNAVNQQTIDPVMKTLYHPIICALFNSPTYLDACALNRLWAESVNSDTFLNDSARQWRYLFASADRRQQTTLKFPLATNPAARNVVINYYPTTVKLEYRAATWDLQIVNNGMTCFRYKVADIDAAEAAVKGSGANSERIERDSARPQIYARYPVQVFTKPGSGVLVDAAEPQLLNLDGCQLPFPTALSPKPDPIVYRYLTEKPYKFNQSKQEGFYIPSFAAGWNGAAPRYVQIF